MTITHEKKIADEYVAKMNMVAQALDRLFNGDLTGEKRKVCFTVLIAEFDNIEDGRVNYISNGNRPEIIKMLKEILARFRAQAGEAENE